MKKEADRLLTLLLLGLPYRVARAVAERGFLLYPEKEALEDIELEIIYNNPLCYIVEPLKIEKEKSSYVGVSLGDTAIGSDIQKSVENPSALISTESLPVNFGISGDVENPSTLISTGSMPVNFGISGDVENPAVSVAIE